MLLWLVSNLLFLPLQISWWLLSSWAGLAVFTLIIAFVSIALKINIDQAVKLAKKQAEWLMADKDVVVLHQIPRATHAPNPSPFPLKLETFLRIAGIKYIIDNDFPMSPKKKTPWISINGQEVTDSQLCIEFLIQNLDMDMDKGLATAEKAISR